MTTNPEAIEWLTLLAASVAALAAVGSYWHARQDSAQRATAPLRKAWLDYLDGQQQAGAQRKPRRPADHEIETVLRHLPARHRQKLKQQWQQHLDALNNTQPDNLNQPIPLDPEKVAQTAKDCLATLTGQ